MKFPIASGNLVLESCASTTFKPCKEKFYSWYMIVVKRSLLSLFIKKFCFMRFLIASGNLALEPCASTTFKPCKKKFYISYTSSMKVVTRSLLSLFPSNFLLYKIQIASGNLALESCASTTFKPC